MSFVTSADIIRSHDMKPHPEGGFFRETYRSAGTIPASCLPEEFEAPRAWSTAILYLLDSGARSALHRIRQDEGWHFYLGDPLLLVEISPMGVFSQTIMGSDILAGHKQQHIVPAGSWFGARPVLGGAFSFVGCTVAPGFDFADFELADRDALTKQFPHLAESIAAFT